ncbi:MAG: type II secretion system secretin GspD, partial [Lautropia sp.]|nr:type II secretion system secretin GspD [Lautropia sp.]
VYLKNAEATKLVEVLQAVLSGESNGSSGSSGSSRDGNSRFGNSNGSSMFDNEGSGSGLGSAFGNNSSGGFGSGFGNSSSFGSSSNRNGSNGNNGPMSINAGGAIIAADPATNALIVTAPEPVYRNIRAVIDQLDSRRAQVYIEALIVEVNADKAAEMGIQWQFLRSSSGGGNSVVGGTNMGTGGSNILSVMQSPASMAGANGLNVGVVRPGPNLLGVPLNLGLLARALETETGANVRATPNLLTLDNEEARIMIGQNVPFVTGQYTQTQGTLSSPFQTIERQDVGTMLRVRPQVSEGGTVKLEIAQEMSSVVSAELAAGIVTNRRAIDSNVLVDDGQIVVLGGLIQDRVEGDVSKVPLLGDIPFLGRLFRYDSRKREKTNMLVFLRPVVLRDAASAWDVTASRYDYIGKRSEDARFGNLVGLTDVNQPGLDPLPDRPGSQQKPKVPPAREPLIMPGAAEDAKDAPHGVKPVRSLQLPQPDLPTTPPPLGLRELQRTPNTVVVPTQGRVSFGDPSNNRSNESHAGERQPVETLSGDTLSNDTNPR